MAQKNVGSGLFEIGMIAGPDGVPVFPSQDGTDATGITPPTGGTGQRGWLSGIYSAVLSLIAQPLPICGQTVMATAGTQLQLQTASKALVNGVIVKALATNQGTITVGGSSVTNAIDGTGNGYILAPGEAWSGSVANLNVVYINGTFSGDGVCWTGS